jgi:hypothetical protein
MDNNTTLTLLSEKYKNHFLIPTGEGNDNSKRNTVHLLNFLTTVNPKHTKSKHGRVYAKEALVITHSIGKATLMSLK